MKSVSIPIAVMLILLSLLGVQLMSTHRFTLKVDQCVIDHAKEAYDIDRYCTALVRKGEYDDL